MENRDEKRGTQLLLDLARMIAEGLVSADIDAETARATGRQVADHVRRHYGGEQLYVPKGLMLVITERDREIWRKFDGRNIFALAKEYDLTERQIYSIIARVREEEFERRQGRLFG